MLASRRLMLTALGIWLYWAMICAIGWSAESRVPPLNPVRPLQVREIRADMELDKKLVQVPSPQTVREEIPPGEPKQASANEIEGKKDEKSEKEKKRQATPPLPEELPLNAVSTEITAPKGTFPANAAANWIEQEAIFDGSSSCFAPVSMAYYWDAPNLRYRPLYFEEPNLERLGYSRCPIVQPATSGIHFFASTLALPYQMTVHHPREPMYVLGHYRPGNPAPYRRILPEWNAKAAAVQAAAVTGLIFIIP